MLSISFGFKKLSGFLDAPPPIPATFTAGAAPEVNGTPSTTNRGLFPERMELLPLMFTTIAAPGSPDVSEIWTPAVLP